MGKCKEDDQFETDPALFKVLDDIYHFQMDAAANAQNTKVSDNFLTEEDDALVVDWRDRLTNKNPSLKFDTTKMTVFVNPPFSKKGNKDGFIQKAHMEALKGVTTVMVLPVKTDTASFHDYINRKHNVQVEFLRGRPKFFLNGAPTKTSGWSPIMIVVFYNAKPSMIEEAKLITYGRTLSPAIREWKQKLPKRPRKSRKKAEVIVTEEPKVLLGDTEQ